MAYFLLKSFTSLFSLPWRERVRVRGIVSGFTLTLNPLPSRERKK
jgi:hypothetical protein